MGWLVDMAEITAHGLSLLSVDSLASTKQMGGTYLGTERAVLAMSGGTAL